MPEIGANDILIPFGTARLSENSISVGRSSDGETVVDCRIPHVVVGPARCATLRLSDGPGPGVSDADADALTALRDQTLRHCDLWSRPQSRFVERYFDLVSDEVERHRAELEAALAAFGSLYDYRDWVFSAPLPLPRAHLAASIGGERTDRRVRVDFAFRVAGRLVAIDLIGTASRTAAQEADRDDLRAAGVEIIEVRAEDIDGADALSRVLPSDFEEFWRGEPFPTGPFAPDLAPPAAR